MSCSAKEGVRVWYLDKRPGCDLRIWPRLARVLAEFRPDVLHTHLSILQYVAASVTAAQATTDGPHDP